MNRSQFVRIVGFGLALLLVVACGPTAQPIDSIPSPAQAPVNAGGAPAIAEDITFRSGEATLAGRLMLPPWPGPHQAVVIIAGRGAQERDVSTPELPYDRPYQQLAEALAQAGIAVLQFEDGGAGSSSGDAATARPLDPADNVEAALAYLASRPKIDAAHVGLVGHGEGAAVAATVATRHPNVAAVAALAGPASIGAGLQTPLLALYAQYDELTPVEQNKPALEEALRKSGNQDFIIDVVPGVNHFFLPVSGNAEPDQRAGQPQEMPAEVVDIVVSWLRQQLQ